MSTLRKIKILATQCVLSPSPTRRPRSSPMVRLHRRKTNVLSGRQRDFPVQQKPLLDSSQKKDNRVKDSVRKNSLKQLFVSAPPEDDDDVEENSEKLAVGNGAICGSGRWGGGSGLNRTFCNGFRCRSLLRRAWRPVLDTITE